MTAGGLVTASLSSSSARVARRFMAPERHLAFWIVAWSAFVSAEVWVIVHFVMNGPVAPLVPVLVVFRIVGGLFAACGLVAWRRRPDNHSGRLMTATGFAFLASPLLLQFESPLAADGGLAVAERVAAPVGRHLVDVPERWTAADADGPVSRRCRSVWTCSWSRRCR